MKHVHKVQHQSVIPTVYSTYSLHWFEALLLSSLPFTIAPIYNFAPLALLIYPLNNMILNFAGHSNYRFTNKFLNKIGKRHNLHHTKFSKNFGFILNFFDKMSLKLKLK